jgi:predicted Zn-dependent protease
MHVESVAWAAERKDVLSTFFWLLSLLAYVRYARNQKLMPYVLSLLFFAAGLMSKPMVVTLPFVLLLLDWWPLNRVTQKNPTRLVTEKIPFFALMVGGCITTYTAQKNGGAISNPKWMEKIGDASVSFINYVSKLVYPVDLSFPYSQHGHPPVLWAAVTVMLLLIWSGLAVSKAREKPYFIVGWFYFLGTLVPTIGLIKVGSQTMADRYSYIPSIGLFIVIVWGIYDLLQSQPHRQTVCLITSAASLILCLTLCEKQIGYWRNSLALFWHSLTVTEENYLAETWMGEAFRDAGLKKQALYLFAESVRVEPRFVTSQKDLAVELLDAGRDAEALVHLKTALALDPLDSGAQQNMAVYLTTHGQTADGLAHFEEALRLEPGSIPFKNQVAWIYATCSDSESRNGKRALQLAQQACDATWHAEPAFLRTLAMAYAETGDFSSAARWLEKARIIAVSHKRTDFMSDFDKYQKAVDARHSYTDPTL